MSGISRHVNHWNLLSLYNLVLKLSESSRITVSCVSIFTLYFGLRVVETFITFYCISSVLS